MRSAAALMVACAMASGCKDMPSGSEMGALGDLASAEMPVPDLAGGGADLSSPSDLVTPDLSSAMDLAGPDLVSPPDLRGADLAAAVGDCLSLFSSVNLAFGANDVKALQAGDWNGDKNLDLAAGYSQSFAIKLGDGKGGFGGDRVTAACTGNQEKVGSLAPGDYNEDGHLDMVVGCTTPPQGNVAYFAWFAGKGDGTFAAGVATALGTAQFADVGAGDWNGDGKLDVMAATHVQASDQAIVLLGNGDGTWSKLPGVTVAGGLGSTHVVYAADWNGDGKLDLTLGISSGGMALLPGKGDGTFTGLGGYVGNGGGVGPLGIADLNGDNIVDFALPVPLVNNGRMQVVLGQGGGRFAAPVTYDAPSGPGRDARAIAAFDADRDGHVDVLTPSLIWRGAGDGTFALGWTCTFGGAFMVTGDFDGNGRTDIAGTGGNLLLAR